MFSILATWSDEILEYGNTAPSPKLHPGPRGCRPSPGASRSAFVLVLERCYLEKRRVNPIRSAFPELHPHSGLEMLEGRQGVSSAERLPA
jgi:hypothetical protein